MNKIVKYWQLYILVVALLSFTACEKENDSAARTTLIEAMAKATDLISKTSEAPELGAVAPGSKADLQKQVDWAAYILNNSIEEEAFTNAAKELEKAMDILKNNVVKAAVPYFQKGSYIYAGTVKDLIDVNKFTIECRIKLTDLLADESSNLGNFVTSDKGSSSIIFRYSTTGSIHAYIYSNGWFGATTNDNVLIPGKWQNLAYTFDGKKITIYVDGVEKGSVSNASPMKAEIDENAPFNIGAAPETVNRSMHGTITEVRFWNITRTPDEIKNAMNTTFTGTEAGLTAYWPFDLNLGSVITDKTGKQTAKATNIVWQGNE